jgi:hypothetical protein
MIVASRLEHGHRDPADVAMRIAGGYRRNHRWCSATVQVWRGAARLSAGGPGLA